jgi:hypothetical protein
MAITTPVLPENHLKLATNVHPQNGEQPNIWLAQSYGQERVALKNHHQNPKEENTKLQ